MEENKLIKNFITISFIMIAIHSLGMLYQFIVQAPIFAIIIKLIYIILFSILLITLYKKKQIAPFIGILLAVTTFIISIKYLELLNIVIAGIIAYYSYKLYYMNNTKKIYKNINTQKNITNNQKAKIKNKVL